ncbi:putative efflux protein [Pseudomonas aeruginosa]|nr:putative efflux protein [Pseudomonas aeruginosa]
MPLALLLAMGAFSLSLSISPGPVNLTIVASGANHGFRRTLPFVTGATLGFVLLLAFVGFWFVRAIEAYPRFFDYLGMAGAAFIAHVGYRIATADPRLALEENGVPGFFQGVLLQWLNPKAWIACASGVALFASRARTRRCWSSWPSTWWSATSRWPPGHCSVTAWRCCSTAPGGCACSIGRWAAPWC